MSKHHHKAGNGTHGSSKEKNGRNGINRVVKVPCGVIVKRILDYDEIWDEEGQCVKKVGYKEGKEGEDWDEEEEEDMVMKDEEDMDGTASEEDDTDHEIDEEKDGYSSGDEEETDDDDYEEYKDHWSDTDTDDDDDYGEYSTDNEEEKEDNDDDDTPKLDRESVANKGIRGEDGMYHNEPSSMTFPPPGFSGMVTNEQWEAMFGINTDNASSQYSGVEREKVVLADLDKPGSYLVVARGGRGGTGNAVFAKRQYVDNVLEKAYAKATGVPGETAFLELELKLIADLGLVGFPNAGKSSLLAATSKAQPEIAPYPFTTLHPLVGSIEYKDGYRVVAADVPGLIAGASEGRGRGFDFLRHLERTKALLYIVDAAGVDGRDPIEDLRILGNELANYGDGDMLSRQALVVANKLDLIHNKEERETLLFELGLVAEELGIQNHNGDVLGISAGVTGEGLGPLTKAIREVVIEEEESRVISQ